MKISEEKKAMIKSFAKHNTRRETAKRFGVCHATVGNVAGRRKVGHKKVIVRTPDPLYFRHEDFTGI